MRLKAEKEEQEHLKAEEEMRLAEELGQSLRLEVSAAWGWRDETDRWLLG